MAEHTPGPWHVYRKATDKPTDLPWIAAMGNKPVAFVVHESILNEDLARAEANARLIAAAPDMLSALQDIVSADGMRPGHVAYLSRSDITAMARAAIAKAEGRS